MRRNGQSRTDAGNATGRAQETTIQSGSLAGYPTPDHELTVLGVANVNRRFDLDEYTNGPSVVFRTTYPFKAMWQGFTSGEISDQDVQAATAIGSTADDPLYPITPFAYAMLDDVWPIVSNLLATGTGNRATVSSSAWVRYNSMLFSAYLFLAGVNTINRLTYHFDWTKVTPFSDSVPSYLYALADKFKATDVGMAETWLPLMKRFETKIGFPRMVEEFKRMQTPMYSVDFNGRLLVPLTFDVNSVNIDADYLQSEVTAWLDYIDGPLAQTGAVLTSFLPFPMSAFNPWDLPIEPVVDLDRETGWWNSGVRAYDNFGDTGDPDNLNTLLFFNKLDGNHTNVYWHTRHTQPTWAEVRLASMYVVNEALIDNTFALSSLHAYDNVILLDDSGDSFRFDGSTVDASSLGYQYREFANTRFPDGQVIHGVQRPGMLGSEFGMNPYLRMMRLETGYQFSLQTLKVITQQMTGSSLRELRASIYAAVVKQDKSGF